jgi:hypothetical protein
MEFAIAGPAWIVPRGPSSDTVPPEAIVLLALIAFMVISGIYVILWEQNRVRRVTEHSQRFKVKHAWPLFSTRICFYSEKGKGYYYEDGHNERIDDRVLWAITDLKQTEKEMLEREEERLRKEAENMKTELARSMEMTERAVKK